MPIYKQEAKIRRIPSTENITRLIAKARRTLATKLTISKETGLRPLELMRLKLTDIDLEQRKIYPTSAKNGSPRILKISNSLTLMIQNHISKHKLKPDNKLFKGNAQNYSKCYRDMRNNLAEKLGKPQIKTIRLYDFRHYFATHLYAKTRDILYVKQQLGHKQIETTLKYVQLLNLQEDEEYICKTTTNDKEATNLIENGFQYITTTPNELMLFKKRK